ncbi:MAG: hypothetical protein RIM99_02925 [Cyclobacteriaceae bacterium]
MKNTPPLQPETFYHVYNRGINSEPIFKREENYSYFLLKYDKYISPIAETYAYCLLNNHFHFLIRTKNEDEISRIHNPVRVNPNRVTRDTSKIISLQFSHFFNGYTQAFNKQNDRTGKLFELPFRRIEVGDDAYLSRLIYYIHANPQKHGLIDDFREYPHSSYHSHLSTKRTNLDRENVLTWFGGRNAYSGFHDSFQDEREVRTIVFDDI